MKFKLHDIVTLKSHANDSIPMVVVACGVDGYDWVLLSGNQLIKVNEVNICQWYDRFSYITEEVKLNKKKSIKNLWGLL